MDKNSDHKKADTSLADYSEKKFLNALAAGGSIMLFVWLVRIFTKFATTYIDFVYSRFDDPFAYLVIPAPVLIMLAMLFIWRQLRKQKHDESA